MTLGSTLALNNFSTLAFDLQGSSDDLLAITGALSVTGGQATIALTASGTLPTSVTLATFAPSLLSVSNFTVTGMPSGYALQVDAGDIKIVMGPPLGDGTWTNRVGDYKWSSGNNWQTGQPSGAGYVATFNTAGQSATTSAVLLNGGQTVGRIVLNTASSGYTIGAGGGDGTLTFDNTGGTGAAGITVSAGSHTIGAMVAIPNGATFNTAADLSSSALSLTISGTVFGAGTLTKTGPGTLRLTSANTYSGGTVVNGGALRTTVDSALGSGPLSIGNAAVTLAGDEPNVKSLSMTDSAGTLRVAATKTLTTTQSSGTTNVAGTITLTGCHQRRRRRRS